MNIYKLKSECYFTEKYYVANDIWDVIKMFSNENLEQYPEPAKLIISIERVAENAKIKKE